LTGIVSRYLSNAHIKKFRNVLEGLKVKASILIDTVIHKFVVLNIEKYKITQYTSCVVCYFSVHNNPIKKWFIVLSHLWKPAHSFSRFP
jgi:hypothetical protein